MKEIHRVSKLNANGHAANAVLVTDSGGFIVTSGTVNVTELNMLNNARSNLQGQIDKCTAGNYSVPNYSAMQDMSVDDLQWTAPSNGIFSIVFEASTSAADRSFYVKYLNLTSMPDIANWRDYSTTRMIDTYFIPVKKGDVIGYGAIQLSIVKCKFIPLVTA